MTNKRPQEPKTSDSTPQTAIERACDLARRGQHVELADMLDDGMDVNACNDRGDTLLLLSAYYGRDRCVNMLLERGASVDRPNLKKQRPLSGACFKGYLAVVKLLIDAGARLEETDAAIKTPLMYAASFEHATIVKLLLDAGARAEAMTLDGETALDLARINMAHEVVALLAREQVPEGGGGSDLSRIE